MSTHHNPKGAYVLRKNKEAHQPYHFVLLDPNGKTLLLSENYTTSHAARTGIDSVRLNGSDEKNYVREIAVDGRFYFVLKAKNHEIIGRGMFHKTEAERDHDIKEIMRLCENAVLIDEADGNGGVSTSEPKRSGSNRYA